MSIQEKETVSLVFLDRRKHPISDDAQVDDDNSVSGSSSDDDTDVGDTSPSDTLLAGVMSGDNNTDQNITWVIDEELARANKISQENDDCQEVSNEIFTDDRQEVASALYYDANNDRNDEELPYLILRVADYDSDDDNDDDDNDDDDNDDDDDDDDDTRGIMVYLIISFINDLYCGN